MNTMNKAYRGKKTATQTVLEVVEKNPGLSTLAICQALSSRFRHGTTRRALDNLRENRHQIENRGGGSGYPTEWYIVERHDVFYKFADELLVKLSGMRPGMRRAYLAETLQEVAIGVKP